MQQYGRANRTAMLEMFEVCSVCEAPKIVPIVPGPLAASVRRGAHLRRGGEQESWPYPSTRMGDSASPAFRSVPHASASPRVVDAKNCFLRQYRDTDRSI